MYDKFKHASRLVISNSSFDTVHDVIAPNIYFPDRMIYRHLVFVVLHQSIWADMILFQNHSILLDEIYAFFAFVQWFEVQFNIKKFEIVDSFIKRTYSK